MWRSMGLALLSGCVLSEMQHSSTEPTSWEERARESASVVVFDRNTGDLLETLRPNRRRSPASITKLMTAIVVSDAIEAGDLSMETLIHVYGNPLPDPDGDGQSDYAGTTAGLREGQLVTVRQLLYGLLLPSGNDAAFVLADQALGGVDSTVEAMNRKASELGMLDTHFVNVHGKDPGDMRDSLDCPIDTDAFGRPECAHYSTAHDVALLLDVAADLFFIRPILAEHAERFDDTRYVSTNRLLPGATREYTGSHGRRVYAGKTGTTERAERCLAVAARSNTGDDVIAVMLGVPLDLSSETRWLFANDLLDEALD